MSIAEPTKEVLAAVDLEALQRVEIKAEELWRSGKTTKETFAELWQEGLEAVHGHEQFLDTLAMYRPMPEPVPVYCVAHQDVLLGTISFEAYRNHEPEGKAENDAFRASAQCSKCGGAPRGFMYGKPRGGGTGS